jgi:hypothetical protein
VTGPKGCLSAPFKPTLAAIPQLGDRKRGAFRDNSIQSAIQNSRCAAVAPKWGADPCQLSSSRPQFRRRRHHRSGCASRFCGLDDQGHRGHRAWVPRGEGLEVWRRFDRYRLQLPNPLEQLSAIIPASPRALAVCRAVTRPTGGVSPHTAMVGAGKVGSAKLPMATVTCPGKPSFSQ